MGIVKPAEKKRPTLGLLINQIIGPYNGLLWRAAADAARTLDFNLTVYICGSINVRRVVDYQSNVVFSYINPDSVDGLLYASGTLFMTSLDIISGLISDYAASIPSVSIGMELEGMPSVLVDNKQGLELLIGHLIENHGRKNIAFIKGPEGNQDAAERYQAYLDALKSHDVPFNPDLVTQGDFMEDSGREAVVTLQAREAKFDALVAANDQMALTAMDHLLAQGVKIPEDISITGFDNIFYAEHNILSLSTISQPTKKMVFKAAEMILSMLKGEKVPEKMEFPAEVILRESCGCTETTLMESADMDDGTRHLDPGNTLFNELRDALNQDVADGMTTRFLPKFHRIVNEKFRKDEEILFLQEIISRLYFSVNAMPESTIAEWSLQQAQVYLIKKLLDKEANINRSLINVLTYMNDSDYDLMTILSLEELKALLYRQLPILGFNRFFLALYPEIARHVKGDNWKRPETARLIVAYNGKRLSDGVEDKLVKTEFLIPPELLSDEKPLVMVLFALFFQEQQYGYFLFEENAGNNFMFTMLCNQIRGSLKRLYATKAQMELEKKLRDTNERLLDLDRAKTAFFTNISHELRSPLTLLLTPLESLLSGDTSELPDRVRTLLEYMHSNSLRLLKLITDLLDFARIEAGRMSLKLRKTDVSRQVASYVSTIKSAAEDKGIKLTFNDHTSLLVAWIDTDLFEKAIFNLFTNALKFTDKGGSITVELKADRNSFFVTVQDTGIGMPEDKLDEIFERFTQLDSSPSRKYKGTGIGLAFTREILELHGGSIAVKSKPGAGSSFTMSLPLNKEAAKAEEQAEIENIREVSPLILSGIDESKEDVPVLKDHSAPGYEKVLVIDDNQDMRSFLALMLENSYQVILSSSGADGLEKVRTEKPDLILCDVMMPEMDGYEVCQILKSDEGTASIPLILISARPEMAAKVEGLSGGADDYLIKPFNPQELYVRARNLLAAARLSREVQKQRDALEKALGDLRAAQSRLIVSEKLASLGQLISGVFHELNTPIGAIRASSGNVAAALKDIRKYLPLFTRSLDEKEIDLFLDLVERAFKNTSPLSSEKERAARKSLTKILENKRINEPDMIAELLVDMGIHDRIDPFIAFFGKPEGITALQMASRFASIARQSGAIEKAIEKSIKVMYALKNYSRIDEKEEKVNADITEGIETVLSLYEIEGKKGLELVKKYDPVPPIDCYPNTLNQVWINLLSNALYAMEYQGVLEIRVIDEPGSIKVSVADSGHGIPQEIQDRVFEPFFSNRPLGEGSGLGLDICKRIVEKHGGAIDFESKPGRTVFTVTLPK
ncbi:MAG: substrate-binding domain-containing protein [Spirochaetales bacterium]|nr:substrate-binding domain-containing protein [Spirochaetales bacterium]